MQHRSSILTTLLLFFTVNNLAAQADEKVTIAILPFVASPQVSAGYKTAVQDLVTKEFVSKSRFAIVDRTKFETVIRELNIQKNEEFLNSKVVDQGKLLGANYLVTGVISDVTVNRESREVPIDYSKPTGAKKIQYSYQGIINLSYQVIDVSTSQAVYSENINITGSGSGASTEGDAIGNALCKLKAPVKHSILMQFPPEIQIVQVEKTSKKGLPDKVLINAGSNLFDEEKSSCGLDLSINKIGSIFKKKGTFLKVCIIENITINGKESKREREIGKLKLDEIQGDVSVCNVEDGAKEIQEGISGGKKISVRVL